MKIKIVFLSVLWGLSGVAQAALIDRGGGMIYDDVLDITWLQDASLGGQLNWSDSVAWADGLSFGGFDDWRLPWMDVNGDQSDTIIGEGIVDCSTATEVACRDNELGYMFYYNLGGMSGDDLTGDQTPFTNIQLAQWSGTDFLPAPGVAWGLVFENGDLGGISVGAVDIAGTWAVRSGDVAVIPLPAGVWLLGSGLLGLAGLRRGARRR